LRSAKGARASVYLSSVQTKILGDKVKEVVIIAAGAFVLASLRAGLNAYKAHKSKGEVIADALEAGLDTIDKKS